MGRMSVCLVGPLLLLTLAGCVNTRLEKATDATREKFLADGGDDRVCSVLHQQSNLYGPKVRALAAQEAAARGLADCSAAHQQCQSMGFSLGTSGYLQCRMMVAQQDAIEAQAAAAQQEAAAAQSAVLLQYSAALLSPRPPPPMPVTCMPFGPGMQCQ